jgi:hypothetical protein
MSMTSNAAQMLALMTQLQAAASGVASAETPVTYEEKRQAVMATVKDLGRRQAMMESRAAYINPLIDEMSSVRDIFTPDRVTGEQARYDISFDDIEATFWMPQAGGIPMVQVEGAEQRIDTFGVHGGIEWSIDVAKDGRFSVVENATRHLANKFIAMEEKAGWALIKKHASMLPSLQKMQAYTNAGAVASPGSGKMNAWTLSELIARTDELGTGGRRVAHIYTSPRRFQDIRDQVGNAALPEELRMQAWNSGGTLNGLGGPVEIQFHKIYNARLVAADKAYAFLARQGFNYGWMPIREEIETMDNARSEDEYKQGVRGRGRYGFGVADDKGLIEITF